MLAKAALGPRGLRGGNRALLVKGPALADEGLGGKGFLGGAGPGTHGGFPRRSVPDTLRCISRGATQRAATFTARAISAVGTAILPAGGSPRSSLGAWRGDPSPTARTSAYASPGSLAAAGPPVNATSVKRRRTKNAASMHKCGNG
jgi:hypothetical protein